MRHSFSNASSGPSGKFCNAQSRCASANQGAYCRQWSLPWQNTQHRVALAQRLLKGRATNIVGCVAALEKGLPFPADCALPTRFVAWLSMTQLSAWPTNALWYASSANQRWLAVPLRVRQRTTPAVVAVLLLYAMSLVMLSMAISTLVAIFLLVHWVMLLLAVFPYLGTLREIGS